MTISPNNISTRKLFGILTSAVAPRPIAFVSTIDKEGKVNLSPFSFFNAFGANPPVVVFSPSRRSRDNTTKHTYENVREVPQCVVSMVNYSMVEQMSLSSTEYDKGINEFIKSGFTPLASNKVLPPRVGESPVSFECEVIQVIELGQEGGAGNLVVAKIVEIHIEDQYLDADEKLDTTRLDLVGRMGGNWYCRANGEALFEVAKPLNVKGVGIDSLPESIRNSEILTGNDLGKLGNIQQLPSQEAIKIVQDSYELIDLTNKFQGEAFDEQVHVYAQHLLDKGQVEEALKVLLAFAK